jgi:hypothetical protein
MPLVASLEVFHHAGRDQDVNRRNECQRKPRGQNGEHVLRAPREAGERGQGNAERPDLRLMELKYTAQENCQPDSDQRRRRSRRNPDHRGRDQDHGQSQNQWHDAHLGHLAEHNQKLREGRSRLPRERRCDTQDDVQLRDQHHRADPA